MNNALINNWNKKVKKTDLIYHIGDFSFKGQEQCRLFESKLNGKIVHILGNHDSNNGVKSVITKAILEFGKKVILVTHVPPHFSLEIPEWCDMVLCGHVHNNWKYKFIDDTPVINVGVDVWDFEPISISTILKFYNKIMKERKREIENGK
jgi:calcineurin-like phosphoesterase family protein